MEPEKKRTEFEPEYKIDAVQQVLLGYQYVIAEVAAGLGISRFLLLNWTKEYHEEARRAVPPHVRMSNAEALEKLRQENEKLKKENNMLKRMSKKLFSMVSTRKDEVDEVLAEKDELDEVIAELEMENGHK